ncbi:MAG: YdcF family protein [Deltaproteobacteria bacterium]|nr:YdcF family protein [Deltaproteobacteria bacterium]
MENTTELKKLLAPKEQRNIGLVTSAWHMPRSERVFKQVFPEDTIVPIPVGYRYTPQKRYLKSITPSARALQTSTEAVHEWIGMLWYTIRYSR